MPAFATARFSRIEAITRRAAIDADVYCARIEPNMRGSAIEGAVALRRTTPAGHPRIAATAHRADRTHYACRSVEPSACEHTHRTHN